MAQPEPLSVDDALDRLIHQFADPMAFFRELVQNAIDAGSDEVEIRFTWARGTMIVHVDDWGSGMTREVIETKLTRLFSSSKDGDRTKIGKFGIGFVSVFAIGPTAVCIDTSREGEHWRVLFDETRSFSLIRRSEPVEGTKIQIFKPATRAEFEQFRRRAREVVEHWCKHLRGEVRVEGEVVNRPFDLDMPCKVRSEHDEEQIVVGHPLDGQIFAGFYNRGLTLLERGAGSADDAAVLPALAFKVSSPRLEHTLTRDDVIRERSFDRVMTKVRELAGEPLSIAVAEQLGAAIRELDLAAPGPEPLARLEYLWRAYHHHAIGRSYHPSNLQQPMFRTVAGGLVRPSDLIGLRNAAVAIGRGPSPSAERLSGEGTPVIWLPEASEYGPKLLAWMTRSCTPIAAWCTATPARDERERERWRPLLAGLRALLEAWGAKLAGVELGHVDCADPAIAGRVAITQREFGEATPVGECGELDTRLLASKRVLVVNADHPTIQSVAGLAQREPELAAYFAAKAFLLARKLDAPTDEALASASHALRERRRSASA
ncbi:sacsin N-terminal ATP-binding-like domain-containing protein [Nannocystaceae bacterium ST9]